LLRLLDERRDPKMVASATNPEVLVLIDGLGPLLQSLADASGLVVLDGIQRVLVEGPSVGIVTVLGVDRIGAVPAAVAPAVGAVWDLMGAGQPGRASEQPSGRRLQLVKVAETGGVGTSPRPCGGPAPVEVLPSVVDVSALTPAIHDRSGVWMVPLGIGGHDGEELGVVSLTVHPGEHVLVAGPPRSGRTTVLAMIADQAVAAGAHVVRVEGRSRSPVLDVGAPAGGQPVVLLVDDADRLDDADVVAGVRGALDRAGTVVVAAVRADATRSLYGHWLNEVRRSRVGILLRPDLELDGDLLGVTLPRRTIAPLNLPGRGFAVADGTATLIQLCRSR
jgi:S-DNA-T family DNA segregation ATPase FtsK/SpoIIIE